MWHSGPDFDFYIPSCGAQSIGHSHGIVEQELVTPDLNEILIRLGRAEGITAAMGVQNVTAATRLWGRDTDRRDATGIDIDRLRPLGRTWNEAIDDCNVQARLLYQSSSRRSCDCATGVRALSARSPSTTSSGQHERRAARRR